MNIKELLIKVKEYLTSSEMEESQEFHNHPIILPERGFVILKKEPYYIRFDEEFHNESLLKIITTYYPTEFDFPKALKKDLNVCLYYLLDQGAVIFENHGLITMQEYQKNPSSIYRSSGELYLPEHVSKLSGTQANILLKYMDDFKRMGKVDIVEATGETLKNQTTTSLSMTELEEQLKMIRDCAMREAIYNKK